MTAAPRGDIPGRIIGMIVFLLGVALLIWVFYIAYGLFNASPATAMGLHFTGNPKTDPGAAIIGSRFGWLILKVLFLFIMSISGSLTSQKGINLYFSSAHHGAVNVAGRHIADTGAQGEA